MEIGCTGFCRRCGQDHQLPAGPAWQAALKLTAELEKERRIDLQQEPGQADVRFSTDYLFGPARGKMFGVMTARASDGSTVVCRAFSGQYNGVWQVAGWVGPVFDPDDFHRVHDVEEQRIKALGREIDTLEPDSPRRDELIAIRKNTSRQLMADIHGLYRFTNFCGQEASLRQIFPQGMGLPTGTGDCCAPKLLQHAVRHGLVPTGMAEFYLGKSNASGCRQHGRFYSSCLAKCYPMLGFLLCGLEKGGQ